MTEGEATTSQKAKLRTLPRNVWAVSLTSFFMDISSEMVINILPLFLSNVLGVRTNVIGLIEGVAQATASLLKVFSGWLSDKLRARKWLAVAGYGLSSLVKPLFYVANSWAVVAGVRWADRVGKGVRTAPRDALVADSMGEDPVALAKTLCEELTILHCWIRFAITDNCAIIYACCAFPCKRERFWTNRVLPESARSPVPGAAFTAQPRQRRPRGRGLGAFPKTFRESSTN